MKRLIFLGGFWLLNIAQAFAIYPNIHNFSRTQSNAGTQNWEIVQHANNWMYFANNKGLLEYDGYHWTTYPIANYTNVRSLYYDETDNRIYAGAFNEFGYYERDERGMLKYHSLVQYIYSFERSFNEIWHIGKSKETIFFQSDREIFRMNGGKINKLNFPYKIECSAFVHDILLVASLEEGVVSVNGDLLMPLPGSERLKNKKICAMKPWRDKQILFVTANSGLFLYDGQSIQPFATDIDAFLQQNQVFCAEVNGTKLALGTVRKGVVIKDLETNETIYANVGSGLQNNTVLSLAFDKQGNLWLGLDKGIDFVMINSPVYNLFGDDRLYGSGYCSLVRGNQLFLGTNQGLYVTQFPVRTSPEPFPVHLYDHLIGQVWSLTEIQNTLFCGADRGGFILKNGKTEKITGFNGTWKFIELQHFTDMILASSYNGFNLLKKEGGSWKLAHHIEGFDESGGMFEEDSAGNIWFCHWMKGISKLTFDAEMKKFSVEHFGTGKGLYTNRNNVLVKIDGEIIVSGDGGFFRYNPQSNRMEHAPDYEERFGFHPHSVRLTQMPAGDIWCVSAGYFAIAGKQEKNRYSVDNPSFFSYLKDNLILGFEQFNPIDSTNILISTENGFVWLDRKRAKASSELPHSFQIMIQKVFLTNEKDSLVSSYLPIQQQIPKFKYRDNSIRFEYSAPEYRDERAVTYSFRLDNFDFDWSAWSENNTKEYTKLPKGNYTFRVRANNVLENEIVETAYQFVILPPWYENIWAIIVYIILLIGAIVWIIAYISKKSQEGAREMEIRKEQEMQEKEKIYQASTREKEREIVSLKNQKLQYELRHKSQELANSTMNVIRKNEILLELNKIIEKVYEDIDKPNALPTVRKRLQTMQLEIKQNIERDDNWKKFAENFDLIYENFLKRLKERFPELTKNDLRLCAYLKMGLSSKDMAPLLNVSYRSVEMCRYRIRQKFDLERDVNLVDFLQGF
ncbi:MAG: hypothetical protein LBG77_00185 [Dysgonamonadaceae bacterium]|jgi:DNA-binding CsgD family transcriptional regulator|nr:hypothetical protein [Dysgonamonadaceae bacterium]